MTRTKWAVATQFFPPETFAGAHRMKALADAIAETAELEVVTAKPSYPSPDVFATYSDDLPFRVRRTTALLAHGRHARRALRELVFAVRTAVTSARPSPDVVIATSPSMFLGPACLGGLLGCLLVGLALLYIL